jgi:HAD superfamily hydrolase (TIGR01490 family)
MARTRGRKPKRSRDTAVVAGEASAAAATVSTVEPDRTAAAFFDVDNTMMVGASVFHFARGMASRGYFTTRDFLRFGLQQVKFRAFGREMGHEQLADARESALAFVAGREVAEIVRLGEEIYDDTMADRIWAGTRALAQGHLALGQRVWLCTATPVELASIIAKRLGLTGALGTVAEVADGRYTGRLVGEPVHGLAKAEAVRALAEREGLDLSRCSAYSDSSNDIPMAINPDPDLKAHAKEHGWPIRDFRTGRKLAKVGVPTAAGLGAVTGAAFAATALRKRHPDAPGVAELATAVADALRSRS